MVTVSGSGTIVGCWEWKMPMAIAVIATANPMTPIAPPIHVQALLEVARRSVLLSRWNSSRLTVDWSAASTAHRPTL